MVEKFLEPVIVDDDTMAFDAMLEAGPGGHFFGTQHTLALYATAFYQPLISDWRNFH
jgi:trimethylamine--corrinoid protein Co-methyltransferase